MSKFNERMRYLKQLTGLNQNDIAAKLNIPISTLHYYLKDREPGYDLLIKIAKEFNVSVNWLVGFDDEDKNDLIKENLMLKEKLYEITKIVECVLKGE